MPDGVKVAWRPVKPFGVGASPTLAANFEGEVTEARSAPDPVSADGAQAPGLGRPFGLWKLSCESRTLPLCHKLVSNIESRRSISSGCNVSSRRPGLEPGGRRCKSCHPDHLRKAGRYKMAAPVSKTGSAQGGGRSITDAFLQHSTHGGDMDSNADAVIQAVFHLVLAVVLHGCRAQPGFKGQRQSKRPQHTNPARPRVQITKPLNPR